MMAAYRKPRPKFIQIAIGSGHACALNEQGSVWEYIKADGELSLLDEWVPLSSRREGDPPPEPTSEPT
jgi:hypothetical protein